MSSEAAAAVVPAAGRDPTRPLPFVPAARGVFALSLEGMLWSGRSLMMALLLGLPVLFAIVFRAVLVAKLPARVSGYDFYGFIVAVYYVRNVIPLAAFFYASALVADEVEGKTLTFLLTRPIRRNAILAGKFAAYVATTLSLTLPVMVVTFFLLATVRGMAGLGGHVPALFQDLGTLALGFVAYGALFTLLGVLVRRPVIPGLLFLFGWEMVAYLPGYLPRTTLTVWLRSLLSHPFAHEGPFGLSSPVLPTVLCLFVLPAAALGLLGLAFWTFSQREYVLEQ